MPEQIHSLSIEKKIGQMFFIGVPSAEFDAARDLIEKIQPGGVCLFTRNIREAAKTRCLLDETAKASEIQPFLSVDQEGGLVDRLRRVFEPMPAISSLKTLSQAGKLAEITAEVLRRFGFNMNFAPVVDVSGTARQKFINGLNSRTFGDSKESAAEFGEIYLKTLEKNGVLGCLKHFPGLGASEIDSHEELPVINISQEELFTEDLFPYRHIKSSAVMIAHAAFPKTDLQERDQNGKLLPSSLSFNFTTRLLRNELDFRGISITDDLEMGAIVKNYGIGEACKMAIGAGADMLAICNNPIAIYEGFAAVSEAVKAGEIGESRIEESAKRIAEVKSLIKSPLPFDENRLGDLSKEVLELKNNQ
jgi:beta-N-acetylhexosaminidase